MTTTDTAPVFRLATYLTVRADFAFKASSGHTVKARAGQVFWVTSNVHLQSVEQAVRVARKGKGCISHGYCFKPEDIERFFIVEERSKPAPPSHPSLTSVDIRRNA